MNPAACVERTTLPAAASPAVAAMLAGPRRDAVVVGRSRQAIYVRDGDAYLAVLDHDAVQVPCGLQTTLRDVGSTSTVRLGGGRCTVDGADLVVRRYVDPAVPRLVDSESLAHTLPWRPLAADLRARADADATAVGMLDDDVLDALRRDAPLAAHRLLGCGPGLTPLGDDVLAGWLATRWASGLRAGRVRTAVTAVASRRTTVVSAALLAHAARGDGLPQLNALLAGLGQTGHAARLDALLAVGSTSGHGLALGAALALDRPRSRTRGER